ncbi:5-formyltetrahydrofolate cyclo-ligase [Maribacter sp. TH_r10]|uniref:5-formyltetrahydrofolate cyclo-ligase n=1 Tax=Maribacter sp. TH_r10 TaxID=3082086 RepID=UPI002955316B|nr:5-formyltetrahydrofolate cyclo-ligase [Maribacter sp. TH_r10]MDV7137860.1 5-formyltetrahydrofolate cyclo-ligase [Maribacter sp. TH_r10]
MLKSDLRLQYSQLRNQISLEKISQESLLIANKSLELPIWNFSYYHIFLPILGKKEIDTVFLLSILQGRDKNVILPKMEGGSLIHYLLTDNTKLKTNKWNVPEPVDGIQIPPNKIEVVFIPLMAYDTKGNRVGYGKGFYDRFLQQCNPDVIKIGLSLFEPEDKIEDVFENDIPLDYCITPNKIYSFS